MTPLNLLSKQRRWQLRRRRAGLCERCGQEVCAGSLCETCRLKQNARYQQREGFAGQRLCGRCGELGHYTKTCRTKSEATP